MTKSTSKIILLVEDDSSDETLRAFKSVVTDEIVVVRDGAEALDYVFATGEYAERSVSGMPDLVLLDLHLPKLSGLDVLARIRSTESTQLLPVVVLTASSDHENIIRSFSLRANAYVRKPVDFEAFVSVAKTLCFFWLAMNEPPPARTAIRRPTG